MSPTETHRYRAVALLRQEDRILLQRETGDDLWALPGGGVEAGESAETTVRRELREELGLEVRMGRPIALIENAFLLWGEWQEQIEIYFEATCEVDLTAREDARGIIRSREAHLEFALFSRGECDELDVRPAAARALLFSKHGTFAYVGRAGGSE